MEVDYVHAQIERVVKNKNIYLPSSYVTLIEGANMLTTHILTIIAVLDSIILFGKAGCAEILRLLTLCS